MKIWPRSFNIYLCLISLAVGCAHTNDTGQKKEESTLRVHLEVNADGTGRNAPVYVTRNKLVVNVDCEPFLTEGDIDKAAVIDAIGGFAIQIGFDPHAAMMLDMITSSNKGRHLAIMTQFPKTHWMAAPLITKRIPNGILTFTPDLTREEAERMVRGLNNVAVKAKKAKKDSFF